MSFLEAIILGRGDAAHLDVVRVLVGAGADVFAVEPREPTLEDVYFEIEARSAGQQPVASIASGSVRPEAPGIRDGGP